mgnify:CR=1 FL=1
MSLILDALNRSRSETGEVPNLDAVHAAASTEQAPRRAWLLWLALICAILVIAWLLLERDPPAPERVAQPEEYMGKRVEAASMEARPAAAGAPAVAAEPEPPQPAAAVVVSEAPPSGADPDVAALYAGNSRELPATAPEPAEVTPPVATDAVPLEEPEKPVAAAPTSSGTQEQEVDIEQIIRRAANELEDARLAEHPAPFISSLSQQVKDGIPTLLYERHDYSGNPGQSRVVLNGQSLARGGATKGVRVEEILPDSVVLRFGDTQFRLRALNSWVNL